MIQLGKAEINFSTQKRKNTARVISNTTFVMRLVSTIQVTCYNNPQQPKKPAENLRYN